MNAGANFVERSFALRMRAATDSHPARKFVHAIPPEMEG